MITHPKNWNKIGQPILLREIEDTILQVLSDIDCDSLSLSGGLDSSLMLYYMSKVFDKVHVYTIGSSKTHPDITYSRLVAKHFKNVVHTVYIPTKNEIKSAEHYSNDLEGDAAVRLFYKHVQKYIDKIIACDGVDEFMCGYYKHQTSSGEETYYAFLRELQDKQLIPLNKNSGDVQVYLPYIDSRLLLLFSQIPIHDKVDCFYRKKMLVELAQDKIPKGIITRRKYGFCDALEIKT